MEKPTVGGQAVIEGVMMRCKDNITIAVRKGNDIKLKNDRFRSISNKIKILKLPFLRGIVSLFEMMVIGIKALSYSANEFADEEEDEETLSSWAIAATIIAAIGLSVLLFIIIPFFLAKFISKDSTFLFNAADGLFRIIMFLGYITIISFMKDIRRVFEYHGAEHKAVHCFEKEAQVTAAGAQKYSTLHPRCGTSFIIIVLLISIGIFSFIHSPNWYMRLSARLVLIPVIAGISYEILKFSAKHENNRIFKILIAPGLWMQKLTTREPDYSQLEVAVAALSLAVKEPSQALDTDE